MDFLKFKNSLSYLLAGFFAVSPLGSYGENVSEFPSQRPAITAPLADKALLLDITKSGDNYFAAGEWGIVIRSEDGENWQQMPVPSQATLTAIYFSDANTAWLVGHDAVILKSSDAGESWEIVYAAPEKESPLLDIVFYDACCGFAVGAYGLMLETKDHGLSWQERTLPDEFDRHINAALVMDEWLFLVGESGTFLRSNNHGETWETLHLPYGGSMFGLSQTTDSELITFGLRGQVYRSSDFGTNWEKEPVSVINGLMGHVQLADGGSVLLGQGGVVLQKTAQNKNYKKLEFPGFHDLVASVVTEKNELLIVGTRGVNRFSLK